MCVILKFTSASRTSFSFACDKWHVIASLGIGQSNSWCHNFGSTLYNYSAQFWQQHDSINLAFCQRTGLAGELTFLPRINQVLKSRFLTKTKPSRLLSQLRDNSPEECFLRLKTSYILSIFVVIQGYYSSHSMKCRFHRQANRTTDRIHKALFSFN